MPIRAEEKARYPTNWREISLSVRARAGWRCEWCPAENGKPHPVTGSIVVLTTAHLDHTPENVADENLVSLCQRCHLAYDAAQHAATAARTRREQMQTLELFDKDPYADTPNRPLP